ncbi:MAG: CRISPR-associated protein Cas4 [Clostridiales bacterium]|jgi:CRISPR-associated exonuclease Cas4|nr:CRISPR-associated protein Cas4 [Clostridiales bacterium]
MTDEQQIPLRAIHHFIYCPRRWGLIHIEGEWRENDSVVLGNLTHTLVNDPFFNEKRGERHISRSVAVFSDVHNLIGVADCVEFLKDEKGVEIADKPGRWRVNVVEYKKSKHKDASHATHADVLQVTGQVICLEEMLGASVTAQLYFADVRQRVPVTVTEDARREVLAAADAMRALLNTGTVPPKEAGRYCGGCSMEDYCLSPPVGARSGGFRRKLTELIRKEEENAETS